MRYSAVAYILLLSSVAVVFAATPEPFLVIAHRGSPRLYPENTMPSFRRALDEGANAIELDVCLTRDDRIVVWHDYKHSQLVALVREVGLETGMKYRPWVPNLGSKYRCPTYELDLATFVEFYGYTAQRNAPIGIGAKRSPYRPPTLDEVAVWAAATPAVRLLFLDVKLPADRPDLARRFGRAAVAALAAAGADGKAVFMTPMPSVLKALQDERGSSRVRFCIDQEIVALVPNADDYSVAAKGIGMRTEFVSIGKPRVGLHPWRTFKRIVKKDLAAIRGWVKAKLGRRDGSAGGPMSILGVDGERATPAVARGSSGPPGPGGGGPVPIRLVGWTINDSDEMRQLIELGTAGIVTDVVPTLVGVVKSLGASDHPASGR